MREGSEESLGLPAEYSEELPDDGTSEEIDDGSLEPVDPTFPFDPAGPNPDFTSGYSQGYAQGFEDATERADADSVDEMALTFSYADLALLGLGFLALAVPVGILLSRTERPRWKLPLS